MRGRGFREAATRGEPREVEEEEEEEEEDWWVEEG